MLLGHLGRHCGPVHNLLDRLKWEDGLQLFGQVAVISSQREGDPPNLGSVSWGTNPDGAETCQVRDLP